MQSVVNGVAYNCGKQFGARSLGPRTHAAQRQRHQRRRNAARDSPVIGTALQTHGGAKKPRPQHVENQEGSGCVLGTCLTAIIDGVWQHDVKYMCVNTAPLHLSTTSTKLSMLFLAAGAISQWLNCWKKNIQTYFTQARR